MFYNINLEFLEKALSGKLVDFLYHLGITSTDEFVNQIASVKAVIVAGSGLRVNRMADAWKERSGDDEMLSLPKEERFTVRYTGDVLFASHGMGMASASIAIHELLKLLFYAKGGDLEKVRNVAFVRVGTSGGVGIEPGTVVCTTEGKVADFVPYFVWAAGKKIEFDSKFPQQVVDCFKTSAAKIQVPFDSGRTFSAECFYLAQSRQDGAVLVCNDSMAMDWVYEMSKRGVKNIEMEAAMLSGLCNVWGMKNSGCICTTLLDRIKGPQVTSTVEELTQFSLNAENLTYQFLEDWIM